MPSQTYLSNYIEILFDHLSQNLFKEKNPFSKRLIVVPSQSMKSWLMLRLADKCGIATGFEICYLDQALAKVNKWLLPPSVQHQHQATEFELSFIIEEEIRLIISQFDLFTYEEKQLWQPLKDYLKLTNTISKKSEKRLYTLSSKLAELYIKYGRYGGELVKEWQSLTKNLSWQPALWTRIYSKGNVTYSYKEMESLVRSYSDLTPKQPIQIHLFGLSYLSHMHDQHLKGISHLLLVEKYFLSPCQMFWSDIQSDKECIWQQQFWKKRKAEANQIMQLEEYLRDRNPLLANFGKLGRDLAERIEDYENLPREDYVVPETVLEYPEYDELINEGINFYSTDEMTLLKAVQSDLTLLRTPKLDQQLELLDRDSIQLHISSSQLREVQVIYDLVMTIINRHKDSERQISPQDILVMAPNIVDYVPFIRSQFESQESKLDAQIIDLSHPQQSSLISGYLHLISLASSRWDVSLLMQLFEFQEFQDKQSLSKEDVGLIKDWIKETGVSWGDCVDHRNELLTSSYCEQEMIDKESFGTWSTAFEKLLLGLAMCSSKQNENGALLHIEEIDSTKAPLLGKWIYLMRQLKEDLKPLKDGSRLPLREWSALLKQLLETYFLDKNSDSEILNSSFAQLEKTSRYLATDQFTFDSVKDKFISTLKESSSGYKEHLLHAVRFCSLLPMRTIPAKVIVLMGMQEGVFPKYDDNFSLNLLTGSTLADYYPSTTDYDRYLFLETILSARDYLLFSYSSPEIESNPSILVTELLNYLDSGYRIDEQKPSECIIYKHPFNSFDKKYFDQSHSFKSYSYNQYLCALSHYHINKKQAHSFVPKFTSLQFNPDTKQVRITLTEIESFAKNPIRTYFNKTLGIYLKSPDDRIIKTEESFDVNAIQKYQLHKKAVKESFEKVVSYGISEGHLPTGPFKGIVIDKLQKEVNSFRKNLDELGLTDKIIYEIECVEHCLAPVLINETKWQVPALDIILSENLRVKITGIIFEASEEGLILRIRDDKVEVAKALPLILIYAALVDRYQLPFKRKALFIKGAKAKSRDLCFEDSMHQLRNYLTYYFDSLTKMSPLIPEWIPTILEKDVTAINDKIEKSLNDPFSRFYNYYVEWMGQSGIPNGEEILEHWHEKAEVIFGELYRSWYSSKVSL